MCRLLQKMFEAIALIVTIAIRDTNIGALRISISPHTKAIMRETFVDKLLEVTSCQLLQSSNSLLVSVSVPIMMIPTWSF